MLKGVAYMEIKVIYPVSKPRARFWKFVCNAYTLLFVLSIFICPFINFLVGGRAWSVVVIIAAYTVWSSFFYPSLFELNRTSQSIKLFVSILLLLISIDLYSDGGWGFFVVPIVSFSELFICSILFFSDFERQKHNALPFLLVVILGLGAGLFGTFAPSIAVHWVFIVLASVSFLLLLLTIIFLRKTIILDLKKQFNTK